jgi:hypothetical protein
MIPVALILFIGCGKDLVEQGQLAYNEKDYSVAIDYWSQARAENPEVANLDNKIAMAYLLRGQELYGRVRNVKAFNGNLVKAGEYMPETPSGELKKVYLNTLCAVAEAYMNARAKNENEKKKFQKLATTYLKDVQNLDSTYTKADSLLQKMKDDHYQKLLNKGKDYFARGRKTRNVDYYFTAEYYLQEARQFDEKNREIYTLLSKIKARTLPVLNYRDEIAMAITDVKWQEEELILSVTVKNYTPSAVNLDLDNFRLIDKSGNSYNRDSQMMDVFYADMSLKNTKLSQKNPLAEGVLVFPVTEETKLYALEYKIGGSKVSRKYFP